MKRKLLSILLTLCLAFSLLPTAALADGEGTQTNDVAQIGSTGYATLAEAVEKADSGATVTLLKDTAVSAMIMLKKSLTLNLNGHKLNNEGNINSWVQVIDNAKLTINGTVEGSAAYGRMNLGIATNNNGSLEINGGIYAVGDDQTVLHINGTCMSSDVTINGATINATNDNGIQLNGKGTFSITNSMITGGTGIYIKAGTLTLENTKVTGTLSPVNYSYNGNGANATGDAVVIDACNYPGGNPTIAIKSGEFTGSKAAIGYYQHSGSDSTAAPGTAAISITGGTFNTDVSAYVADGYILNNGTVEKLGETNAVAKVGDTYYKTLAEAINAVSNDATITLLKDAETTVELSFTNKAITLDLNGKTVSGTFTDNFSVIEAGADASLTVQDTSVAGTGKIASNKYGISARDGGALIVKSGTIESEYAPLSGNNTTGNMNFTVNGGTLTAKSGPAIYMPGQVSLTITDGVLNGGISLRMGQVNISGGTINAITTGIDMPTDTLDGKPAYAYSGNVWFPDALYVIGGTYTSTDATYGNSLKMNITGGTFNCANGQGSAVAIYDLGKVEQVMEITISDEAKLSTNGTSRGAYDVLSLTDIGVTSPEPDYGNTEMVGKVASAITGGTFSSDPSAYVPATHHVEGSNPYTVKEGATEVNATITTAAGQTSAAVDASINETDKDKINAVKDNAAVSGVVEAIHDDSTVAIVAAAGVTAADISDASKKIVAEINVNVNVTKANLTAGTMTFEASPEATVKVNGTATGTTVPVTNDMLNGKPITVKLPLPTVDGQRFTPKQIKHTSSDGSVEYFLDTQKTGAKTFEIKDGCAVFTITKFSTFELSGVVTYVEPSYSSGSSSYDPTYSVSTPSKTEHGSVTVSPKSASKGDRVTVTVKPDSGYVLETLTVTDKNGNELTLKDKGNGKYTFTMPAGKVEVKATFMEDNSMLNFFYDVPNNAYFYEAVKWAVKNGITTGVGNDLFAPEQPCTRAQIVTFLWRAAGSPEPKGAASGMTDVVSGSYYEKAVAWAIENGITTGTTTSTFSPDATCTRAQAVTFLARALKAKAASAAEFSDVPTGSYFADAVAWAAANGVTEGIGGGLFGSDNDCTRGQIVTFLYRAYNK